MRSNANLAGIRPNAVRELDGLPLVAGLHALAVPAVGPESEPQRILEAPRPHVGLDPGTPGLAIGVNPVKTIGEQVAALATENDDRRKSGTALNLLRVLVNDLLVDGYAHLRASVEHEGIESQGLADRDAGRELGRMTSNVRIGRSRSHDRSRLATRGTTRSNGAERTVAQNRSARASRTGVEKTTHLRGRRSGRRTRDNRRRRHRCADTHSTS